MEKRRHLRVNENIQVEVKTPNGWSNLGTTFNLSESGLGISLEKKPPQNAVLNIRTTKPQIETQGRIAWIDSINNRCGIEFIDLVASSQNTLLRRIHSNNQISSSLFSSLEIEDRELETFFIETLPTYLKTVETRLAEASNDSKIKKEDIFQLFDDIIDNVEESAKNITSKVSITKIKKNIRKAIAPWLYQSDIIKRGYEKPRGYPGDYGIIETIYDDKPISNSIGKIFDLYLLENRYANAVKKRKDKMREVLYSEITHSSKDLDILNIACGSCREIRELLDDPKLSNKKTNYLCIDQDPEALEFTQKAILQLKKNSSIVNFLEENIMSFIQKPKEFSSKLGKFDIVYSIGLIDYLPDRLLKSLISFLFSLLKEKGKLILPHKDIDQYNPRNINWYCDWNFYPRNEEKLLSIIRDAINVPISIKTDRENTQTIFFTYITKKDS